MWVVLSQYARISSRDSLLSLGGSVNRARCKKDLEIRMKDAHTYTHAQKEISSLDLLFCSLSRYLSPMCAATVNITRVLHGECHALRTRAERDSTGSYSKETESDTLSMPLCHSADFVQLALVSASRRSSRLSRTDARHFVSPLIDSLGESRYAQILIHQLS